MKYLIGIILYILIAAFWLLVFKGAKEKDE